MSNRIDIRGMTASQSLPLVLKNITETEFHPVTTVTDSLSKLSRYRRWHVKGH